MNHINPRNTVAFMLILFVALILYGSVIAQEKNKPFDAKAAQRALSTPEIVMSVFELPPLDFTVTDTALLRLHIAYCDSTVKRLRAEQSFCKQLLKLYYPLKRK